LEIAHVYCYITCFEVLGGYKVRIGNFYYKYSFWNVDYVDGLDFYPLKSINRMEGEFLSLCEYNLFVSAELYMKYYIAVRELNNPLFTVRRQTGGRS
jgi:hypothetical protein